MSETDFISKDALQLTAFIDERNQQSMDYFYDKYSPALYGTIYHITNNKHVAEECLLATFVKAWNEIATFRPSGNSLFTWLLHLARQAAFAAVARKSEKNSAPQNFVNGMDQPPSAFELVYFKGFSLLQAAELSGIPLVELKSTMRMDLKNMNDKTKKA